MRLKALFVKSSKVVPAGQQGTMLCAQQPVTKKNLYAGAGLHAS